MLNPILNATLNLTQSCNLACSYCFNWGKTKKTISYEIGKKCIDFLLMSARKTDPISLRGRKRAINVTFWGGEPLIEWDLLKKVISYIEKVHGEIAFDMGTTTNGTLLTEDRMKFLKDHRLPPLVSFDGTAESHDRYRHYSDGRGSHATIAKNIEKGLKIFPALQVRMSPYADGIHRFYDDVKYIIGMGIKKLMFSPVFESNWTAERWDVFKSECGRVSDLLIDYKKKGMAIDIEHYKSYAKTDGSRWPCGAGRFYVGFDVDGSIYPCHRFIKFSDMRRWQEKEVCIGHVEYGITNPGFRNQFVNFKPSKCTECEFNKITPCHGGCYAVNYDLTGDIRTAPKSLCEYTRMQSGISQSYRKGYGPNGFPEAIEVLSRRPMPSEIMSIIVQMERNISIFERMVKNL